VPTSSSSLILPPSGDGSAGVPSYQENRFNIMNGRYDMGLTGDQQNVIRALLLSLVHLDEELDGHAPVLNPSVDKNYRGHLDTKVLRKESLHTINYDSHKIMVGDITTWLNVILDSKLSKSIRDNQATLNQFIITSKLKSYLENSKTKDRGKLYFVYAHQRLSL
jgi:hypothetical protein